MEQGSWDNGQPRDALRAEQESELSSSFALASMEFALAREAYHVGAAMREAGLGFDPLTFVALRILEVSVAEETDPSGVLVALSDNGSLERSVELATEFLADEAA